MDVMLRVDEKNAVWCAICRDSMTRKVEVVG